jgi:hypothetical protein
MVKEGVEVMNEFIKVDSLFLRELDHHADYCSGEDVFLNRHYIVSVVEVDFITQRVFLVEQCNNNNFNDTDNYLYVGLECVEKILGFAP